MEIDNLMAARQLMRYSGQLEVYRNGKKVEVGNAQEMLEEDEQLISGESRALYESSKPGESPAAGQGIPNDRVHLGDLIGKLKELDGHLAAGLQAKNGRQAAMVVERESISIELEFASSGTPIDGLVKRNQNLAETDRYQFIFKDGATFTIRDKWTNRSTTIWGDPHVDLSDMEGDLNGEFSDLKGSNTLTTMMLMDGSRVTFNAPDTGVIETVDIFKGNQRLSGVGVGSKDWGNPAKDLFGGEVTQGSASSASTMPAGDTVYASGDGNDWVDAAGRMVWGMKTGPGASSRPAVYQSFSYTAVKTRQIVAVSG